MDDTRLFLVVGGFADNPDAVTEVLGLPPTRVLRRGEPFGPRRVPRQMERWELDAPLDASAPFDVRLAALLDLLAPHAVQLRAAAEHFSVAIQYVAYYRETFTPGYHFSAELLQRLAAIGVELDLDTYVLYEEPSDPSAGAAI